jgi:hypothetical protein
MANSRAHVSAPSRPPVSPAAPPLELDSQRTITTDSSTVVTSRSRQRTVSRQLAAASASLVMLLLSLGLAIAPATAMIMALWAAGSALITLWRIIMLARAGRALTSPDTPLLLASLDTAARAGCLAISYLALIFALMALMAGLFGRGWGRLFILPGATFTITALALICLAVIFAAPLANHLPIPTVWLIPLAIYALVDAILVSGVMIDTRLTRSPSATGKRRAIPRRARLSRSAKQKPV